MTVKTLVNALDTCIDKVEYYTKDWDYMFSEDAYTAGKSTSRVKKFRVYESEETVILMVTV